MGPLVIFAVADPMRVDSEVSIGAVQKVHDDGVADLATDDRAEHAEPCRLRLFCAEGSVGVLDVAHFIPFRVAGPRFRDEPPMHEVLA